MNNGGGNYMYAEYLTWDDNNFYEIEGFFDSANEHFRDKSRITFSWE